MSMVSHLFMEHGNACARSLYVVTGRRSNVASTLHGDVASRGPSTRRMATWLWA